MLRNMVKCPSCKKGELLPFTVSDYVGVGSGVFLDKSFKPEYRLKIRTVYRCTNCGQEFNISNLPFSSSHTHKGPSTRHE